MNYYLKHYLLTPVIFCGGFLPLSIIRALGAIIGVIGLKISKKAYFRTRNNLLVTGIATPKTVNKLARQVAVELGKTLLETIFIAWLRSKKHCYSLVKQWRGFDKVLEAQDMQRPIIFLTPHIGNFELMVKAAAYKLNKKLTILYKPSKDKWFEDLMVRGRSEDNLVPVATTRAGILQLMRGLKKREYIGILPDSVASQGDGVWVRFFNVPVFATTLLAKLIHTAPEAAIFIAVASRVPYGFALEFIEYKPSTNNVRELVQDIYTQLEQVVKSAPSSYFWSYDRFRVPDHAQVSDD